MHTSKLIGLIVGTSLAFSGFLADSASAQLNNSNTSGSNLTNITGTNVFTETPFFTQFGGLNPQTIETSQQLNEQLTDALVSCNSSKPSFKVRAFLLGDKPQTASNQTSRPEKCEQLNTLLGESKTFLEEVKQQVEATKASIPNRTW
ncbi:MAG: hypothetical protein AAF915_23270 [Cyanobacteria bacterium P01_D01_bin.50]